MRRPFRDWVLISVAVVIVMVAATVGMHVRRERLSHDQDFLQALWQSYKQQNWKNGQTIDQQTGLTTSEGQAYTLLRAVWQNDKPTFAATWDWTTAHLQRGDKLFSWEWGPSGILTGQGGQNTASDADTDIALALLMADARWRVPAYRTAAHEIIGAIWQEEVVMIGGKPLLTADNLEKASVTPAVVVNPSYFAPYAYRIFAHEDPADNWTGLAANSYAVLQAASRAPLNASHSANIPPDWILVDRHTGQLQAPTNASQNTDFGYDALRTIWRTAVDVEWFHNQTAQQTLGQWGFLASAWSQQHKLWAVYGHDGQPKADYTSLALYGGTLDYFQNEHADMAHDIVQTEFTSLYDPGAKRLTHTLSYYDNSWVWFGLALYSGNLPNLADAGGSP